MTERRHVEYRERLGVVKKVAINTATVFSSDGSVDGAVITFEAFLSDTGEKVHPVLFFTPQIATAMIEVLIDTLEEV